MNIVIIGGNECMVCRYKELCREYNCNAKIYPKMSSGLKNIGTPDLLVVFTGTTSHKMVRCAMQNVKSQNVPIARCHTSSLVALRNILTQYAAG